MVLLGQPPECGEDGLEHHRADHHPLHGLGPAGSVGGRPLDLGSGEPVRCLRGGATELAMALATLRRLGWPNASARLFTRY
jgi:hypothetical protein